MEDNYSKAYKEIIEILKYVPEESVNKIPLDMMEMFKANMDNNYEFEVDINKSFEEQNLLEETKAIFANIFRDYWATQYQKEKIVAKERNDREKQEEKRKMYNPDDIFKKKQNILENVESKKVEDYSTNLPVEVKETFYKKIINFFKNLFHLN